MDLHQYKNSALQKHIENKKFLENLKHKKPKTLDKQALNCHIDVFKTLNCLDCANCCKTTGPLWRSKDIERVSKALKLKPSQFIDKYLKIDEDNDYILQQLPCCFLDADHKCLIYENRPKACVEFPHTDRKNIYQINALTIENIKICPAAYEWIEKMKNIMFKK